MPASAPARPLARTAAHAAAPGVLRRRLCLLAGAALAGCAAPGVATKGAVRGAPASEDEWLQSDANRMATLAMRANLASLFLLMDKLYRRNPLQWRQAGQADRTQALAQVRTALQQRQPWAALGGRRDVAALAWALAPEFSGDRVAALGYALADVLITAHGGRTEFFLLDAIDAQHVYNAARNVEIAAWLLAQRRDARGQPLLLADAIDAEARNLSFEREFGKIVARLDLLAQVLTEKYRRAAINTVQGLVGGGLLQFLPVR